MSTAPSPSLSIPLLRTIAGWLAVAVATCLACFWAFWGIIENFHEGWYYPSLGMNLALMFCQYLLVMLLFQATALAAIRWPWVGGGLFIAGGLWAGWFFRGANIVTLLVLLVSPLLLLGLLFIWGRPQPRRWALLAVLALPLLTLVLCGAEPVWRVAQRCDDGDRGLRVVAGNGVRLVWAPAGPGWPDHGLTWHEAVHRCRHLSEDGLTLADAPQDLWRLPTMEEVVRSSCRQGRNAGGTWNAATRTAQFTRMPDKESPLWDVHTKIIYWWTGTEADEQRALRFCYNGHTQVLPKNVAHGYLGFRAVRELPGQARD